MKAVKSKCVEAKPFFNTILIVQFVIAYYSLNFLITVNIAVIFPIRKIELCRHLIFTQQTRQDNILGYD